MRLNQSWSIRRFSGETDGSVAIIFAVCVIVLCGMIGGAIDTAVNFRARTAHIQAVDAAAIAGARVKQTGGTDAEAIERANTVYQVGIKNVPVGGAVEFRITASGNAVEGVGQLSTPSTFLRVLGINDLKFDVANAARFAGGTKVEMSLMLDTTGSMQGAKLAALQSSVDALFDIVLSSETSDFRVAIAPFSNAVQLGTKQYREATGATKGGGGCVVEREIENYDDQAPSPGKYLVPLATMTKAACTAAAQVFPLSNKKSDLKKMVQSLSASGSTAGHLGTAWAWYLLSPQWAALFDTSEMPAPYSQLDEVHADGTRKLRKIAVLMTDGEYNTSYNGIDSNDQARSICAELKKTKIEVYTIGFEVDGKTSVLETLQKCASAPQNFYNAKDAAALNAAFQDIALKSQNIRLTK